MATIYRAEIRPTKLELIGDWLPRQPWYTGEQRPRLVALGAYRFDDPDGQVGIETHLVRADDGTILQVPLTYRDEPLPDGQPWLVGTMEHSVLGTRWVYDGCGDPVYATAVAGTIVRGGTQAEEVIEVEGRSTPRPATASVTGSGSPGTEVPAVEAVADMECSAEGAITVITWAGAEVTIHRVLDPSADSVGDPALTGTWAGQDEPVLLATARQT